MCLDLTKSQCQVLIAEKDIVCYKFVNKVTDRFFTPYRGSEIIIGETYTSELKLNFDNESVNNILYNENDIVGTVEKGLHSFKSFKSACKECQGKYNKRNRVVKCIIPKGSSYYVGVFGDISFASDKLKYVKIYSRPISGLRYFICNKFRF